MAVPMQNPRQVALAETLLENNIYQVLQPSRLPVVALPEELFEELFDEVFELLFDELSVLEFEELLAAP